MKNLTRKLDFSQIMTNHGNVSLLSNVFLEPYQMKIISQNKRSLEDKTLAAQEMSIEAAIDQLYHNTEERMGGEI